MEDIEEIVTFIRQFSFGTIITNNPEGKPIATHLPFLLNRNGHSLQLISHFAKANEQWETIAGNEQVLVIFQEPHAYISPRHYDKALNVPTWNYLAAHLYGTGRIITAPEDVMHILNETVKNYEPEYQPQYERLPEEFKQKMRRGIVAFDITVTNIQAKKKLSQNKTRAERERIIQALTASPYSAEKDIAAYMRRQLDM